MSITFYLTNQTLWALYSQCSSCLGINTWSTLTLIFPKSICFWMVYICSVLSIRLAPSLQLVTNCWNNKSQQWWWWYDHDHKTHELWEAKDCVWGIQPQPFWKSLPCWWRAAPKQPQSTPLSCLEFSGRLSMRWEKKPLIVTVIYFCRQPSAPSWLNQ